jgi:hypothetical protein
MVNGSTYLRDGAPQRCALCNAPLIVERRVRQVLERKRRSVLLLPRARRFRAEESPCSRRALWEESVMRRCDYCGGKLGLCLHQGWL